MPKRIFVGNLPYSTTDADLSEFFGQYGEVSSAVVMMDQATSRSRGYGFVEMADDAAADAAIADAQGKDMGGRKLTVDAAKPRPAFTPRRDDRAPVGDYDQAA